MHDGHNYRLITLMFRPHNINATAELVAKYKMEADMRRVKRYLTSPAYIIGRLRRLH